MPFFGNAFAMCSGAFAVRSVLAESGQVADWTRAEVRTGRGKEVGSGMDRIWAET